MSLTFDEAREIITDNNYVFGDLISMALDMVDLLEETYKPVLNTTNHKVYMLSKQGKHMTYNRYFREVNELREQDNDPHLQGISSKTWAGIYYGFITVREDPKYTVKGQSLTDEGIEAFDASGGFDSIAQELADLYDQEEN